MSVRERFLRYIAIHTASDPVSTTVPSAMREKDLAKLLVEELLELGLTDAHMDEKGYVYAHLPARNCDNGVRLGLIAHMDTSPDFCGENVRPQIIENYDGSDVVLGTSGRTLRGGRDPRDYGSTHRSSGNGAAHHGASHGGTYHGTANRASYYRASHGSTYRAGI